MTGTTPSRASHWRVPPFLLDLLVGVFLVGTAFLPFDGPGVSVDPLATLPWLVGAAIVLPLRRRAPVPVLVASALLYGAAALGGVVTPAFAIPAALATYSVAVATSRRTTLVLVISVAIALPLFSFLRPPDTGFDPSLVVSAQAIQLVATIAFAAAFGDATRSRRATLVAVTERAIRAEQTRESEAKARVAEERLRIARDLHDLVAHQIAVINLQAGVASKQLPDHPADAERSLDTIRTAARSVLAEITELLGMLRRSASDDTAALTPVRGLDALPELLASFESLGLVVEVARSGEADGALTMTGETVAYRVIQEALTNAHKHGAGGRCRLELRFATSGLVIVAENRVLPGGGSTAGAGHGLLGMRERIELVGGTLDAGAEGTLFRVTATIPARPSTVGVAS